MSQAGGGEEETKDQLNERIDEIDIDTELI